MSRLLPVPRISVVIPAHNASGHIKECLDGVFSSQFEGFEVIVVDDDSGDDTLAKAASPPCRILKNETNKGAAVSRNRGADEAKAEIILFLDSDILISSSLLTGVWKFFEEHPEVSVLQGRYGDTPYYRNLLSQYKHYIFSFRGLADGRTYVNHVHTACVAIRKNVFQKCRFDEGLKRREDVEFGLRCSERGYLIYADPELKVGHKKKYNLFSFSAYQFQSARELVLQYLVKKNKNFVQEFKSGKQPLYKKAWLLRPALSFILLLNLISLGRWGSHFLLWSLMSIVILSFLLEYRFRFYLLRVAQPLVFLGAGFLYFYDGWLIGLGVISGICQAIFLRRT